MASFEKVTSDANETVYGTLLDGYRRLSIPLFQRSYQWGKNEFKRYADDVEAVVSGDASTRFIGAVVVVERTQGPNLPTEYEIVDGQQRLFTIYLTILAAAYVIAKNGTAANAATLMRRYLYLSDLSGESWNTKLSTSLDDSAEFADLWKEVLSLAPLALALGSAKVRPPAAASSAKSARKIKKQFDQIRRWLTEKFLAKGEKGVEHYITAATANLSFVWLSLQDPASAPRIFESLNNRGVRTTVGDLVRNEIFARLRDTPTEARALYDHEWKDFLATLGDRYEDFFFPYGLVVHRNAKKSELFTALRDRWSKEKDASAIIANMQEYVAPFLAVAKGITIPELDPQVNKRIARFKRFRLPSAVFPFLMQLLHETKSGAVDTAICCKLLDLVESFLIRRALCGNEPTGLHAVFKALWHDVEKNLTHAAVSAEIRKRKTVQWPGDAAVKMAVAQMALYGSSIANYVLTEYDRSLGGDVPSDPPEVEHVLPQKLNKTWSPLFPTKVHERWVNTWANLVPLSSPMNKSVSQGPYAKKREKYEEDSMYKTPRKVAKDYKEWTVESLQARTLDLQKFAVERWID